MRFPRLQETSRYREMTTVFGGYNHQISCQEGQFYDMKNMTSDHYPVLSPRKKRGFYVKPASPQGLIAKEDICYVDGSEFVIGTERIDMGLSVAAKDCPKKLVSMGAYVIIMPDKKYVNTKNFNDIGRIEAEFEVTEAKYEMCKADGNAYTDVPKSSTAPENPTNMQLWIDTSTTPHSLKQYSASQSVWNQVATTYIKISAVNIAQNFKQYDGVKMTGFPPGRKEFEDLEGKVNILYGAYHDKGEEDGSRAEGTDDYIMVVGFLDEADTYESNLRLERRMPMLDFIIESNNRLWGCRYGEDIDGNIVNEIYASKLGDFKNWNCFAQISTDSYVASVGTDGQFTGAITYLGYPIFFKENHMHKVYGNYPANYQIQTTACRGVQKGCSKSLAIVNETLYYKSRSGICTYDGSLPVEISAAFGDVNYSDAVAGALSNKYYISMMDAEETYHLFVYDSLKGMWHREDNTHALEFCTNRGDLYYIDDYDKDIKVIRGTGKADSELITIDKTPIKWEAISGIIGTDSPDKKYISRLDVRLLLTPGSTATFYAEYDSSEVWEHLHTMVGTTLRSFAVPIRPKRCDHLRLRIVGQGDAKIYSICKTIEQGSDV